MFTQLTVEERFHLHERLDSAWWAVWMKNTDLSSPRKANKSNELLRELGGLRAEARRVS